MEPLREDLKGRALSLPQLVEYQGGSIVSRMLLSQPAGSVTLFAFDAGESLSEHTAPYDALVQVLEGELLISISGKPHSVPSGQAIIMPAHEPHALKAQARSKMLLTMLRS